MTEKGKGVRSTYSQCPFQIYMCDDCGVISTGTGFFYSHADEWHLITNWHNLSGRHFLTKEYLSDRVPAFIEVKLQSYAVDGHCFPNGLFTSVAQRIDIYKDFEPVWFEHPDLGSTCDVIAPPMKRPETCPEGMHNAANLIGSIRIPVKPGNTTFIIGFPRSISVGFGLPLWKAGYVASEPFYDVTLGGEISKIGGLSGGTKLPAFFIDSLTREGMSGSPVFAQYTGTWDTSDPYKPIDPDNPEFWHRKDIAIAGNSMEFVGCYSGRIGKKEESAALGLCWREDVIQKICSSKKIARYPHNNEANL
jgi:hypothetical protein